MQNGQIYTTWSLASMGREKKKLRKREKIVTCESFNLFVGIFMFALTFIFRRGFVGTTECCSTMDN